MTKGINHKRINTLTIAIAIVASLFVFQISSANAGGLHVGGVSTGGGGIGGIDTGSSGGSSSGMTFEVSVDGGISRAGGSVGGLEATIVGVYDNGMTSTNIIPTTNTTVNTTVHTGNADMVGGIIQVVVDTPVVSVHGSTGAVGDSGSVIPVNTGDVVQATSIVVKGGDVIIGGVNNTVGATAIDVSTNQFVDYDITALMNEAAY